MRTTKITPSALLLGILLAILSAHGVTGTASALPCPTVSCVQAV